jgi:hypothetical protein
LARANANLLVGGAGSSRSKPAWNQVYRAISHSAAKDACQNGQIIPKFPKAIEDFANTFVTMQIKRESADYDPFARFTKSAVEQDIRMVRQAIQDFEAVMARDRRAFCAHVLFKKRPATR